MKWQRVLLNKAEFPRKLRRFATEPWGAENEDMRPLVSIRTTRGIFGVTCATPTKKNCVRVYAQANNSCYKCPRLDRPIHAPPHILGDFGSEQQGQQKKIYKRIMVRSALLRTHE